MKKLSIMVALLFGAVIGVTTTDAKVKNYNDKNIVIQEDTQKIYVYGNKGVLFETQKVNQKVYTTDNVNIRKRPTVKGAAADFKVRGTKLTRIAKFNNGWDMIRIDKEYYFVWGKYTSLKKPKKDSLLKGKRKINADIIANICIKNYKKYKVLPSICIGQAIVESGLGEKCNPNNFWGISSHGYRGFPSLQAGVLKYLSVINNGYYKRAVGAKSYVIAAYAIQRGGYCCPAAGYAEKIISAIRMYRLTDYDRYVTS